VKPGEYVKRGQGICTFIVTDEKGSTGDEGKKRKIVDVTTRRIIGKKFVDFIELPGEVIPFAVCHVASQVGGKIVKILVEEGESVKRGDLLAIIDDSDYRIRLDSAEARYELAKVQYERTKNLTRAKASSISESDSAEANLKLAKAELENCRLLVERCKIVSPISGIVDGKFFEEGEVVGNGDRLLKIIDISKVKIRVGIPEKDVRYVMGIKEVKFRVGALGNREYVGRVTHIGREPDKLARLYPMELVVDNNDEKLLPAMYVDTRVVRGIYENSVVLPIFQIISGDDGYYTFIKSGEVALKKEVKLGSFHKKNVHILSGIKPGDELIVKGLRMVGDGTAVRVVGSEN
jgi:RND family efflux transporter MFP subunit